MNLDADLLELKALSRWPDVLQEVAERSACELAENPPDDGCTPGHNELQEGRPYRQLKMIAEWTVLVERLWRNIRERLEHFGLAADLARTHAVLIQKAADDGIALLTGIRPHLSSAEHRDELDATCIRLDALRRQSRPLLRSADLPVAQFDPERVRLGLEEAARGEGVDAEEWLTQLRREATK